jgi:MYND finger
MQELVKAKGSDDLKRAEARKARLRAWYTLGKEVGLTARLPLAPLAPSGGATSGGAGKGKVREGVDGCWWEQCERHGRVDEKIEQMLSRCSRCKTARYCSGACQQADWAIHKVECKVLRRG